MTGRSILHCINNNNNKNIMTKTEHRFERSGLGIAPFRYVATVSIPSPSLAEQNPSAYELKMRQVASINKHFGISIGACYHCGMPLVHNVIIRDSEGKHSVIGCDCAQHIGDQGLANRAKVEKNRIARKQNAERKAAKREAWLNQVCGNGETNRERMEREARELRERWELEKAEAAEREERELKASIESRGVNHIYDALIASDNGFHHSLAEQLGRRSLSPRQAEFVCKFWFPTGRRNKKNASEWDDILDRCTA